jgi:DNA-binding transcriptional ArsR family regulator
MTVSSPHGEQPSGSFFNQFVELPVAMSPTTSTVESRIGPLPEELESPRAKLVYLALAVTGGASVAELNESLGVPKLTLLSVLDALTGRELVERRDDGLVAVA